MGVLIEFPGSVKNVEKAMERITLDAEAPRLQFDRNNQWRPAIPGCYVPAWGLLVRVKRDPETRKILETQVVGKYDKQCRFRLELADFRMLPPAETDQDRNALCTVRSLDLERIQQLAADLATSSRLPHPHFAPPCFTLSVFPFHGAVQASIGLASASTIYEGGKRRGRQAEWTRCFADVQMPSSPPVEILSRVRRLHRSEYQVLLDLFNSRPVWLRSALQPHLPNVGPTEFRAMMPSVAYFFMDGPWRCCWVRYGYDPRHDSTGKLYQVVEMRAARVQNMVDRFPAALRKEVLAAPSNHTFDGIHIVANLSQFQYCDLTFPPIQSIITNPRNHLPACEKKEGWFVQGTLKKIRAMIKDRWLELVKKKDPIFFSSLHNHSLTDPKQQDPDEEDSDPPLPAQEQELGLDLDLDSDYEIYE